MPSTQAQTTSKAKASSRTPMLDVAMSRDLAHYNRELSERQCDLDDFCETFGLPKTDLAWVKTVERAQHRAALRRTSQQLIEDFRAQHALKKFAQALQVQL